MLISNYFLINNGHFLILGVVTLVYALTKIQLSEGQSAITFQPTFIRRAVESPPERNVETQKLSRLTLESQFGDNFLPLRSAVENVPSINEQFLAHILDDSNTKSFVRAAVEASPVNSNVEEMENLVYDNLNHDEIESFSNKENFSTPFNYNIGEVVETFPQQQNSWLILDRYAAFSLPNDEVEFLHPQPYRSDSPYQQLLKASDIKNLELIQPTIQESYNYTYPLNNQEYMDDYGDDSYLNRPYGALAYMKQFSPKEDNEYSHEVLCYITNSAFHREADAKFVPEYINKQLCTKIIYSFATLDPDHLSIKEFDPWVDLDNQLYNRTITLGVPTLIALGGWTDSSGDKYSRLAADDIKRKVFASNLVSFIKRNGFAGLHLDWTYPKCWQSDCSKGPSSDKPNFTRLLHDIRSEFDRVDKKLKLGIAISGYKEIITEAYEFPQLSKIVDYLTVMAYDYHGAWEGRTGHVSPLYGRKSDKYPQYNADYTMKLLLKLGARRERIIMGIPFYGQTFTLQKEYNQLVGEGIITNGPGKAGEFTKQPGMLAYYEICQRIRKTKWIVGRDDERKVGPYAMMRNQWVGYEDTISVQAKTRYAIDSGFGGVAAWTIDLDDFQNRCCSEAFPLLSSINRAMGRLHTEPPKSVNCKRPSIPVIPTSPTMSTISSDGSSHQHTTSYPSWQSGTTSTTLPVWWISSSPATQRPTTLKPTKNPILITNKPPQSLQTPSTTIPPPTIVRPMLQTSNCQLGNFYSNPQNCNTYYHCVMQGELRLQYCPDGLHWNNQNKICDWPGSANCKTHKLTTIRTTRSTIATSKKPTKYTTQSSYWTSKKPLKPFNQQTSWNEINTKPPISAKCNEGEYYTHRRCSQYYICVNGVLVPNSCGSNLHWDGIRKICDWPENVKCITTERYLRLIQSKANPEDPCNGEQFVPYPGECTKFLFCLWNRLQAGNCPPGLHFNPAVGNCDWPEAAKCSADENNKDDNEIENKPIKPKPTPTSSTNNPLSTKLPIKPTNRPITKPLNGYYKIVCYFTNWAWYRQGLGRYTPDDINTNLCTHIVYGFAVLDYSELTLRTHDSWADIDNNFYTRVSSLKNKGIKVSLALGGWNDSQGDKYSRLVRSAAARSRFIRHAVEFLQKYGFEGLDLDWEYPVCWQTDCKKGFPEEKKGFTKLVQELSEAFTPRGLLLSTAVSPSKVIIDAAYDVSVLAHYFDWIAVMTYDFHGQWDKKTGHVAPLFYHPDDDLFYFNANYSINYWIKKGAPSRKLVMGMPLYGQSFTLDNINNNGLNAKASGPGEAGEFTRAAGFLAYYEICDRIKYRNWEVVQDAKGRMGPFARKGNQWVSFDDPRMLRRKSRFIQSLNLGGAMVWALDLDDFRNHCGDESHPLLTQIYDVLKDAPNYDESAPSLQSSEQENHDIHSELHSQEELDISQEIADNMVNPHDEEIENISSSEFPSETSITDDFKVVCYFTNWAWYRQAGGKYLPEDINAELCTHIVYGFSVLNRETLTIQPHDSWADIDNHFFDRVSAYRKKGVKVTVAIGGWNDSAGDKYSRLVRDKAARSRFIKAAIDFIEKYGFDGLDLDWEYPVCWQVNCKAGHPDEKKGFSTFVREISEAFKPRGWLLSSAVSPNKKVIDAGYDVPALTKYFDWIAVMCYDYHGQWDKKTGHVAPMYDYPGGTPTFNANFSINYWIQKGADRKKLVMGMPMYGQSFTLAQAKDHGLNAPTYGGGEAGEATRARGFLSYYEICTYIQKRGWYVVRDSKGRIGPYAYLRDQWVSFDDASMIQHKSEYVKATGLGGAMIWALDLDDFKNVCNCESYPLLKTINRVLRNYRKPKPVCILEEQSKTMISNEIHSISKPGNQYNNRPEPVSSVLGFQQSTSHTFQQKPVTPSTHLNCGGKTYAGHKKDCNKYYVCQYGEYIEQKCPAGLHWNQNYCDWPQSAHCKEQTINSRPDKLKPKPITKKPTLIPTKKSTFPPTLKPTLPVLNNKDQYKIVCYFTNWAWYRPGLGKYLPEDIDENLCTHIVYGFAVLNSNTLTITTHDAWADIDNKFYERVVNYKRKGIRVSVAIGGWNDSLGNKYSRMVLDPEARHAFVESVLLFIEKYGFDGLDLDWEYPVCWQVDCSKGSTNEKVAFAHLVRELHEAFKPRSLLLSAAVSPSKTVVDAGYDVSILARYFDWIGIMTYDFHGHWDRQTGHVAPLYYTEADSNPYFNSNFSVHYWISKGAPSSKLIMGIPLYGQSFTLAENSKHNLNDKSVGPGRAGTYTKQSGFLAFYEICEQINNGGWTVIRDHQERIGPYAFNNNQWVSYDDVAEIRRKAQFIKKSRLAGGMIWALDLDDFRGRCGCGKHPLLKTLNQELRNLPGQSENNCT